MFIVPSIAIALDIKDVSLPTPLVVAATESKRLQPKQPIQKQDYCSCVALVKKITGYDKPVGLAKNWPINSDIPIVGAVVITNDSALGHVALITELTDDTITVIEANYEHCKITTRIIDRDSPTIRGYYLEYRRFSITSNGSLGQ